MKCDDIIDEIIFNEILGSTTVAGSDLTICDEGNLVATGVDKIDFVGDSVTATDLGNGDVRVEISGSEFDHIHQNIEFNFTQSGHDFPLGPGHIPVYNSALDTWTRARADLVEHQASAFVTEGIDADTIRITIEGRKTIPGHGLDTLQYYFLNRDIAGDVSLAEPVSGFVQPLFWVEDEDTIIFRTERPNVIEDFTSLADKVFNLEQAVSGIDNTLETTGNDGYALIELSGVAKFRKIKAAYVFPTFDITAFSATTSVVEVGSTAVTPSFTASYNNAPDAAALDDDDGNPTTNVSGTPTAFSSPFSFVKTANNAFFTFTLSADEDGDADVAATSISWRPRTFWGTGISTLSTEGDIEALANSALDNNRNRSFTVTAGVADHIYYAYPTSYGAATFTVGGFSGGFSLISSTISVTNSFGVTQDYRLYRSDNANLGLTTVVVT